MKHRVQAQVTKLAETQHGLVTRKQLLAAGIARRAIDSRVKCGILIVVHRGVYQASAVRSERAREWAAILACKGGVISHASAAGIWGISPSDPATVHLIMNAAIQRGRRPGIRAHRMRLRRDEVTHRDGLKLTTLARTLIDVAPSLPARDTEQALAAAMRLQSDVEKETRVLLERYPRMGGMRALRALVFADTPPAFVRSEAEARFLSLIRSAGLPLPEANVRCGMFEVDFLWRTHRLVAEIDGYEFHASRAAFHADRRRDLALNAAGFRVVRIGWRQLNEQRDRTLVQLTQIILMPGR